MRQLLTDALGIFGVVTLAITLAACTAGGPPPSEEETEAAAPATEVSESAVTYFEGTGTLEFVDEENGRVTIEHDEIPGFMDAMTMRFDVKDPASLVNLAAGTDVRFRIAVDEESFYITEIGPGSRKER